MASGTIELHSTGTTGTDLRDINLRIGWSETPNAADNSSTVAITSCQYSSTVYGGTWYPNGTIKINGQTVVKMENAPATHSFVTSANGKWYDIAAHRTGTLPPWTSGSIAHNADGSKSVAIQVDIVLWQSDEIPQAKFSGSQTVTLDKLSGTGGLVSIGNGSGWDDYRAYIDNGTGWDPYVPYIDTGTGWVKY